MVYPILTEEQRNCPHPNIVEVPTPPTDSQDHKRPLELSQCDLCGTLFSRHDNNRIVNPGGDDGECVDCESKGVNHIDMLRGVVAKNSNNGSVVKSTGAIMSPPSGATVTIKQDDDYSRLFTGRDTTLVISHDNDPKFQKFPQYSPNFPPKPGEKTAAEDSRSLYDASKGRVRKLDRQQKQQH